MRLLLCITAIAFLSCNKHETPACENWEVYETCHPKKINVFCSERDPNKPWKVCGKDLQDAHDGRATIIRDNEDVLETRVYVKRLPD